MLSLDEKWCSGFRQLIGPEVGSEFHQYAI